MTESAKTLFPLDAQNTRSRQRYATGVLPCQVIKALARSREITASVDIADNQIQPASMDLRLSNVAYRVRASFLPGAKHTVAERIETLGMHQMDLSDGAILETGCVYIVPLMEHLALSSRLSALANPKSSAGRLDIFTRVITDRGLEFDRVSAGYQGPLYAEISPRTFSIVARRGSRLNQLRVRRGSPSYSDAGLRRLHDEVPLVDRPLEARDFAGGRLALTVDLRLSQGSKLIGFKARKHTDVIDVDRVDHYDPLDYWEPIYARGQEGLILNPGDFYILASKEAVTIPSDHAAEMLAYDTLVGEFRAHYAGFFDPGFGYEPNGGAGTRAVLEVRSHEVPFMVDHGQIVGRLVYERLTDIPDKLYGPSIGSSYQNQGLALSKHFRPFA